MTETLRDLIELAVVVDPMYDQNCYVLHRRDTRAVLVVDPGLQHTRVLDLLDKQSLRCERILLTHGHPDHVSGVPSLKAAHDCTAAIHPDDRVQLAALHMLPGVPADVPDVVCEDDLGDGQTIHWNDINIEVMHTPGHTQGSVCFRVGPDLVSGDTLFKRGVGRADLPGGDWPSLMFSIENRLYTLPPETVVYPGHGSRTTIREEQELNPFVVHPRYR
ncbi:MAG: MBL fold metallo-hydrolase [Candidatus Dormibacteraeota bacterium]|nr:MBL fold metallo-hydrolase [Candidatus Dormibacteraeota bacterium]